MESDRLVTGTVILRPTAYAGRHEIIDSTACPERLEALPGVESASFSYAMPFFGLAEQRRYLVAGARPPQPGHEPAALINGVTPPISTVARPCSAVSPQYSDSALSPKVFVITRPWPAVCSAKRAPSATRLAQAGGKTRNGVRSSESSRRSADRYRPQPVTYQLYQPIAQEPRRSNELAVRTRASRRPRSSTASAPP